MLKPQVRVVLRNCGMIDPDRIDHYLAVDGYAGLMNALQMTPEEVIGTVRQAGLRGRGGAGFPTFKKWTFCRNAPGDQKYLICNADEGDPVRFMNRSLIESDPHAVLEGMLIAGYAIGAAKGIIYIRAEYPLAIERLKNAIGQMREYGLAGRAHSRLRFQLRYQDKGGRRRFRLRRGDGAHRLHRGQARHAPLPPALPRPIGPLRLPHHHKQRRDPGHAARISSGTAPTGTRRFGKEGNRGTKTFSLVGKIRRPGLIEVQLGTTLREIIYDIGGGLQKPFKAIQTGGPSGGCLSEEFLDLAVDYESLAAAGSIMGSGGLIVMDEDTCIVDLAKYFLDFHPEGVVRQMHALPGRDEAHGRDPQKISHGEGSADDLLTLRTLGDTIRKGALCGLGQTAPNPVLTTLHYFRNEYLEHIKDQRCRAVVCKDLIEYRVIQEKCTGCQSCVRVCPTGAISGPRSEPHNLDTSKCIKCRSCYEVCRFEAIAGDAIVIRTAEKKS